MRQERKVVTVLFCDLVGFTSRAEEMDPEDVAALLAPYQARLKDELERYGGKVEPVQAWLAVAPRARLGVDVFQVGRAPLIGREQERALLATALSRARSERQPQLVTLVGVPGVGKSRLVHELYRIVDEDPDL